MSSPACWPQYTWPGCSPGSTARYWLRGRNSAGGCHDTTPSCRPGGRSSWTCLMPFHGVHPGVYSCRCLRGGERSIKEVLLVYIIIIIGLVAHYSTLPCYMRSKQNKSINLPSNNPENLQYIVKLYQTRSRELSREKSRNSNQSDSRLCGDIKGFWITGPLLYPFMSAADHEQYLTFLAHFVIHILV